MKGKLKATFKVLMGLREVNRILRDGGVVGPGEGIGIPVKLSMTLTPKEGAGDTGGPRKLAILTMGRALKAAINKGAGTLEVLSVEHIGPGKVLGRIGDA